MSHWKSSNLGYPRIGENREWKRALESFWSGKLDEASFLQQIEQIRLQHLQRQQQLGIDLIPVGDFSYYDHMLDAATMFGLVPERFGYEGGPVSLATYYAMARGNQQAAACEMTKWFNTNYHYIVPELADAKPQLTVNKPLAAYREAKQKLGIAGKPVLIGPYTFIKLSKGYEPHQLSDQIEQFLPLYEQILLECEQAGVEWMQIDEPVLVTSLSSEEMESVTAIYRRLAQAAPQLNIMLQTYFEAVDDYSAIIDLPVRGIGLDLVHGYQGNWQHLQKHGFPADKVLGVGMIDGRNIWAADYEQKLQILRDVAGIVSPDRLIIQPSCSLLHVPVTIRAEAELPTVLRQSLSFADEKLEEVVTLVRGLRDGVAAIAEPLADHAESIRALNHSPERNRSQIQQAIAAIHTQPDARQSDFAKRRSLQQAKWRLPVLPTTTIGSFPQTAEVRQARSKWRKREWSNEQYRLFIREKIAEWIRIQEEIGLDVLVHGEFERTDMVEFFGEQLGGFAFTRNGWVQSYGSRCVKPPIIYGDVEFLKPMTVEESVYAQTLTDKPVKGMLTGPITILNWSFVRDDLSREQVTYQIALALRAEVEALEQAGIEMIQVDEPALREGLPLKVSDHEHYLDWAVRSFRLATSTVRDATQIHTHMCYCEFHDIMDAIRAMDADVISIETSRSHGELIGSLEQDTYDKGIGLGVYDIHSPRVPAVSEMVSLIRRALRVLDPALFWINPDCGLKTRGDEETIAALRNMVQATQQIRVSL